MSGSVRTGGAVSALAVFGLGTTAATPASSVPIAYIGKIPALHDRGLYIINSDGSDRQLITPNGGVASHYSFSWSPDGQQLTFTGGQDERQIVVVNADGSGLKALTSASVTSGNPAWSPDGELIAFDRDDKAGNRQIWVMRADGTEKRKLTSSEQLNDWPTWSPDGGRILFERYYGGERMVFYTMHRDGKTKRRIAQVRTTTWTVGNASYYYCACAAWSPDGRKIAYEAVTERKKPAIFVMNADGTNPTRLTRLAWSRDENPDWSPDGTQIAFYSERKGNGQVYVMNADGTNQHRVTRDPWYDCCPRWKPASAGPG